MKTDDETKLIWVKYTDKRGKEVVKRLFINPEMRMVNQVLKKIGAGYISFKYKYGEYEMFR